MSWSAVDNMILRQAAFDNMIKGGLQLIIWPEDRLQLVIRYDMIWYIIWYDIWYIIWYMIRYDTIWYIWYDIYLLTAIGLTTGGSSTVHIYIQTIHTTSESTQTIRRTTQLTNWEECGPCPVFASYTLAFALRLRKMHGKTSVRVAGSCLRNVPQGGTVDFHHPMHYLSKRHACRYTVWRAFLRLLLPVLQ